MSGGPLRKARKGGQQKKDGENESAVKISHGDEYKS
jgi:hypothetical protein